MSLLRHSCVARCAWSSDIGALLRIQSAPWTFGFGVMYQNLGGRVFFGEVDQSAGLGRNFKVGSSVTFPCD